MARSSLLLAMAGAAVMTLTACESEPLDKYVYAQPHYWQRVDSSSALYLQGPKAQQKLNSAIAGCVAQLRELERLGAIHNALPGDTYEDGSVPDPDTPAGTLAQYDTPRREGALRAENLDFHDFETCMTYYGWERVEHVPYSVADNARETYLQTITGEKHRTKTGQRPVEGLFSTDEDDFAAMNE